MTDLNELLERVRKAEGPDSEIDRAIFDAVLGGLFWPENGTFFTRDRWGTATPIQFTASLDAITALIAAKLPGWLVTIEFGEGKPCAMMLRPGFQDGRHVIIESAATLPLALCAAFLSALISKESQS